MNLPEFFVVGAPKCGTTAINEYLRQHPQIFIPDRQKDLAFFGTDLHRSRPRESLDEFAAYYASAPPTCIRGEVCVWYLYSESAPSEILSVAPEAEIFIILRNPVDLVYSQHSQLVYSQDEDILRFEDALDAEPARRAGRRIPPAAGNRVNEALHYRFLGDYSQHVERYLRAFDTQRVHVLIYEEFAADPSAAMKGIFKALGVEPTVAIETPVVNANKVPRSAALQRHLRRPPRLLEAAFRAVAPKRLHGRLIPYMIRFNTRYTTRAAMSEDTRSQLEEYFAPDVARLEVLLDRDLGIWRSREVDITRRPA